MCFPNEIVIHMQFQLVSLKEEEQSFDINAFHILVINFFQNNKK